MQISLPPMPARTGAALAAVAAATGLGGCVAPAPYYGYNYPYYGYNNPYYGYNYSYYGYNYPYYRYRYPSSYYDNGYATNTTYPYYSPYFRGVPMAADDNGRG